MSSKEALPAMPPPPLPPRKRHSWTFLTNHGHVLLSVATDPGIRVTELAERVGITPRAALQILKDLENEGYLHRSRVGRRTHYTLEPHQHFRHPTTSAHEIDELILLLAPPAPSASTEDD